MIATHVRQNGKRLFESKTKQERQLRRIQVRKRRNAGKPLERLPYGR